MKTADSVERQANSDRLILTPNLPDPDGFYDELLHAHDGLSKEQSDDLNARLVLLLCNHIGDRGIITQALNAARDSSTTTGTTTGTDTGTDTGKS
ncbi:MAG: DUF2783 domain-containing protein [Granulosicoccus sp.]|nr:DUF2783 domain-containing protein [Granulosicoccus sp.]